MYNGGEPIFITGHVREHPELTSQMFSFLAQEAYKEIEDVDASILRLVIKLLGIQY